ncbi:hypothetical protein PDG61_08765 [Mycolicibacterium sp. BiH015]|uniref:hypothetical protein n=1 Tax=Mycolicibacterium sp. BiH015 TaxID=3018808 RepID=UPI0022E77495|nr:hypothetical protein [Mycolicibacterium sp. BiH015]MDA2891000.1 hypothetical protein [Mycolicibacterium sp. BiH015]
MSIIKLEHGDGDEYSLIVDDALAIVKFNDDGKTVDLTIPPDQRAKWELAAEQQGTDVESVAMAALDEAFTEAERKNT